MAHTPGPWAREIVGTHDVHGDLYEINRIADRFVVAENVCERDAHLISAAPDLLAALEAAPLYDSSVSAWDRDNWLIQRDAAIKKAKGEK